MILDALPAAVRDDPAPLATLVRSGTTFTGYYSTDDVHWTLVGIASVPTAAASQDVGVAMTSHSAHVTGEVDFDHFTVTG